MVQSSPEIRCRSGTSARSPQRDIKPSYSSTGILPCPTPTYRLMGSYAVCGIGGRVLGDLAKNSSLCVGKRFLARAPRGVGERDAAHRSAAPAQRVRARGGPAKRAHHRGYPALSLDLPGPRGRKLAGGRLRDEAAEGPAAGWPRPGAALSDQDLQGELSRARRVAPELRRRGRRGSDPCARPAATGRRLAAA